MVDTDFDFSGDEWFDEEVIRENTGGENGISHGRELELVEKKIVKCYRILTATAHDDYTE